MGPAGIDLAAFRASIGSWAMVVGGGRCRRPGARTSSSLKSRSMWIALFYLFLLLRAVSLLWHGDVHQNPGPASPRSPAASSTSSVDAAFSNGSSHSKVLSGQRFLDFAGGLMIWNRSDMHLTSGEILRRSCSRSVKSSAHGRHWLTQAELTRSEIFETS